MDIGKSFTFMFEDENWITKILVGGLFVLASFVLVGIPFLVGYAVQLLRNLMAGMSRPLPEWDNLGEKFREGLLLTLIYIIWLAPVWLLACLQSLVSVVIGNNNQGDGGIAFLSVCVACLSTLWGIVVAVATPALMTRFAMQPEFKSGFEFNWLWEYTRDNIGNVIIAVLIGIVASIVASLGVILCVVGVLFTTFWYYLVQTFLYGEVYRNRKGALPMEPPAPVETPII